jgi:hypothetical protein
MTLFKIGNHRGPLVILSEAKDLSLGSQMLRYAQHDTTSFGRYSSLSALAACSRIRIILLKVITTKYGANYISPQTYWSGSAQSTQDWATRP